MVRGWSHVSAREWTARLVWGRMVLEAAVWGCVSGWAGLAAGGILCLLGSFLKFL